MFSNVAILDLSTPDLVIILAICLLLFGSKKLPELARSLGSSARELKKGMNEAASATQELREQTAKAVAIPVTEPVVADGQSQPANQPAVPAQRSMVDGLIGGRRQF